MKNSCVTSLYMEECGIDSNAVEDIKKLLLTNTTLKRLVLNANSICDEGAMCLGECTCTFILQICMEYCSICKYIWSG